MKKFFTFFMCAAVLCSCASGKYSGKGRVDSIAFPEGIHAVEVSGAISVTASADAEEMTVSGDSLALENFIYSFSEGTLSLGRKTNVFKEVGSKEGGRISVVIPQTSKLSSVTVSGASRFVAEQPMTAEKISVKLSGASKVKAEIQAGVLSARVTGASSALLCGKAGEVSYSVSGASQVSSSDAYVSAGNAKMEVSGASSVKLGSEGRLTGSVSGASRLICYGDCVSELQVTGASTAKTGR
ncbi:MAG: DUF2807 domain-containing protein [Bacteroidales bacterium]|nr:DUF2807 domain-containing protein [Bacteroidales bacterium]